MNKLLINCLVVTSIMLIGCNSEESTDNVPVTKRLAEDVNNTQNKCAQDYFNETVSTALNNCVSCHSADGDAKNTSLVLSSPLEYNKLNNYKTLKAYIESTDSTLVEKGSGEISHGGGTQLSGSAKKIVENFVAYVKETQECISEEIQNDTIINAKVQLLSPARTLRNASYKIQGKAPSNEEVESVSDIQEIDAKLDAYMQSDAFYNWLRLSFNDFLLTDFYNPGRMGEDLLNSADFPNKRWWDDLNDEVGYDRLDDYTNYAISREPIELMVHVIKENRPFSEILTADYVMVNPFSARTYNIDIDGFTYVHEQNVTKAYIEEKYPQDSLREAKIEGIPHAGLLTTITFLNRFPSTNTNLDRHRSAKTQLFFLDTDILGLANRPINSEEVLSDTATWTNSNCTVCHNVMEPISSAFKNWDNRGRYMPGFRGDAVQVSGMSLERKAPDSTSNNLLQWLAKEIVKDDRFAKASVKIFYKALMGREAMIKPSIDDMEYVDKLEAYRYEDSILEAVKEKFIDSGMNAKLLIKELIKSPLFRATSTNSENIILSENLGQAKLITPEALDAKIHDVMGYYWNRYSRQKDADNNNTANHRLLRNDNYKILYGGINSGSVSTRVEELNGVMANVQMRMALQMSCYPVSRDFFFPSNQRKLFPYVTRTLEPENEFFVAAIKKNIQHLHKHILGEDLDEDDEELEKTYELFLETYNEGKLRIENSGESKRLMSDCEVHWDPITWEGLWIERPDERIYRDPNYVIRSWQVVIAYLLSDFKFVYENSTE